MDDRAGMMRRNSDAIESIEDRPDRSDVLLQGTQDRRRIAENGDSFGSGDGESSWHGSGENESSSIDTLEISELNPEA